MKRNTIKNLLLNRISLVTLAALFAITAEAQVPAMIGEKESFTANTGIARLGSAAAPLYNPAGLVGVKKSKLSASGTLFQSVTQDVSGSFNVHSESFQSIPTQISNIGKFGDFSYAVSVFTVQAYDYVFGASFDPGSGIGQIPARIKANGTSLVFGPSIAKPVRENLWIGASLFIQKDDEYASTVARLDRTVGAQQTHVLVHTESQNSTYMIAPLIGVTFFPPRKDIVIGARVIGPALSLKGDRTASTQSVGYIVNGGTVSDASTPFTEVGEKSKADRPIEIAVGGSIVLPQGHRVYADASNSFKQSYSASATSGTTEFQNSIRLSAGAETGPSDATWAAGVLYQQNALRAVDGTIPEFWGITAGYIRETENLESGLGLSYIYGSGSSGSYKVKVSSLGLLLSTSFKF